MFKNKIINKLLEFKKIKFLIMNNVNNNKTKIFQDDK